MSAYDNETYLQSLGASRADAERQIQNTLNEVNRQRDVAFGQTGQIAGATANVFRDMQGQADAAGAGIQQGLASLLPPEMMQGRQFLDAELAGSLRNAFGQQQASYARAADLYRQGFDEMARTRTAGAQNIGNSILSDLDRQRTDYIARREAEDRQRWFEAEQANRQRALQEAAMGQAGSLAREQMANQAAIAAAGRNFDQWMAAQQRAFLATLGSPPPAPLVPSSIKPTEHMILAPSRPTTTRYSTMRS